MTGKAVSTVFLLCLTIMPVAAWSMVTPVSFPASDGISIRADYYTISRHQQNRPLILLFHQAGWSRGEFVETAPLFNELGYHCLAVDLRSGQEVNGVINETATQARKAGKKTGYCDAYADLEAAIAFARSELRPSRLLLLGSSYSAALILRYAGLNSGHADALIAFSPGEYFSREGKERDWIRSVAKEIRIPVWITSAGDERQLWAEIFAAIPAAKKASFLPKGKGRHGASALWKQCPDSPDYWRALGQFLSGLPGK